MGRVKTLDTILKRSVYVDGKHEAWRTQTVRDADGVTYAEPRPLEERYYVEFPPIIDAALFERAQATGARNVWHTRRNDRPAESGLLRYGFAHCGGCGRPMAVHSRRDRMGRPRYRCQCPERACPAPACISLDVIDERVWSVVLAVLEDPWRAADWRMIAHQEPADPLELVALVEAEQRASDVEGRASTLLDNLALISGPGAELAADRLNDLNAELGRHEPNGTGWPERQRCSQLRTYRGR